MLTKALLHVERSEIGLLMVGGRKLMADDGAAASNSLADDGRTEEGEERRGEGGRMKKEGGRRKEEGYTRSKERGMKCAEKKSSSQ